MVIKAQPVYALALGLACVGLLMLGCSESRPPVAPGAVGPEMSAAHSGHAAAGSQGLKAEKGFIDGWFDGNDVDLHYTKLYFCAEPPTSGAPTDCVIGADAEVPPRGDQSRRSTPSPRSGFSQIPRRWHARPAPPA